MQRQAEEKDRKQKTGKVVYRKGKRQKRIGSERTKIKKYVSFRKYITAKERMKKTTELRTARYICAGDIASRDPKVKERKISEPFHFHAVLMTRVAWSKLSNNTEDSPQQFVHKDF